MTSISGTIKRLVSDKGFGFVQAGDGTDTSFTSQPVPTPASTTCAKGKR